MRRKSDSGERTVLTKQLAAIVFSLILVISAIPAVAAAGTTGSGFGSAAPATPTSPGTDFEAAVSSSAEDLSPAEEFDRSAKIVRGDFEQQLPPGVSPDVRPLTWADAEGHDHGAAAAGDGHAHDHANLDNWVASGDVESDTSSSDTASLEQVFEPLPAVDANTCVVGVPTKTFDVAAINVDIPVNRFGDHDPEGRMFVLTQNIDDVRAQERIPASNPDKVQHGLRDDPIQPLVIRANMGDCVTVNFENQLKGESASFHIHRGEIDANEDGSNVGVNPSSLVRPGESRTYTFQIPDDDRYEGSWYFHSHGDTREQVHHGLFGVLNVEHKGSTYLHPRTGEPLDSGWEAIIVDGQERFESGPDAGKPVAYREYTLIYHEFGDETYRLLDKDGNKLPLIDPTTHSYRPCSYALNYRSECWMERLKLNEGLSEEYPRAGPDGDKSLSYNSYAFGDPATPMPRAYVADPSKIMIVHGGGEQFHSHHLHGGGIRWLFEPHADSAELHDVTFRNQELGDEAAKNAELDPRSESRRLDAQTIGPGETFTSETACGAGGCQRAVGDFLFHCHIPDHYVSGMWGLWRVYNTKQADLAELPTRTGDVKPAVTSVGLLGTELPSGRVLTEANVEPWVESNLPPQGKPEGYDATVYDWEKVARPNGVLYLTEPEDTRTWANFASETPGERTPITFDPVTGRLAFPWLSPHLGARIPFAPGHGPAPYLSTTPGPDTDAATFNALIAQNNNATVTAVDPERPDDAICPAGSRILRYNIVAIQRPVEFNEEGDSIDDAMVYVLAEDLDGNGNPTKPIEPLIYRANVGDCVQLTFTNALPDGGAMNGGFNKASLHPHFVQFDPQGSDGAVNGFDYEQTIRPYATENRVLVRPVSEGDTTLVVTAADQEGTDPMAGLHEGAWIGVGLGTDDIEIHRIAALDEGTNTITLAEPLVRDHDAGGAVGVEFTRHAYYIDVDLGNVYFHDHVDGFTSWPRGLFGTLITEPKGSKWLDPTDHSKELRSGAVVDIDIPDETKPVFSAEPGADYRELALLFTDNHGKGPFDGNTMGTVNLRAEPLAYRMGGGPERALSSTVHGDPSTPMLEAYEGDPVMVHLLNGGTWSRYPFRLTGHEFAFERIVDEKNNDRLLTTPRDAIQVDASERFDLWVVNGAGEPGDYLWYISQADHFDQGMWGIMRVHDKDANVDLERLPKSFPTTNPVETCAVETDRRFDVVAMEVDGPNGIQKAFVPATAARAVESGRQEAEPLVLRAAAGECIAVDLTNRLDEPVSMHIGGVKVDPQTSLGITVGNNPDQSVAPGETRTYHAYAHREITGVIADFAQLDDETEGQADGLYGAVVVAPAGSDFRDPATGEPVTTGTEVVVVPETGEPYRDAVLVFHEEDEIIGCPCMPYPVRVSGDSLVNYRSESLYDGRLKEPATAFDSDVHGDPVTPLLEAYEGDPMRIHVLQGFGYQNGVFALNGHGWQRDSGVPESSVISTRNFAPHIVFDAVLEGGAGSPGDYLWSNHRLPYMEAGHWGLLRVHGEPQNDLPTLDAITAEAKSSAGATSEPVAQQASVPVERDGDVAVVEAAADTTDASDVATLAAFPVAAGWLLARRRRWRFER